GTEAIAELEVRFDGLVRRDGGGRIARDAGRIRFARMPVDQDGQEVGYFDELVTEPVAGSGLQPVWLTVEVPADAEPGIYTGVLRISGGRGAEARVPVELNISRFTLPRPDEYRAFLDVIHSPDTISEFYDLPLYSDEHFDRMIPSLRKLGRLGSQTLYITAVRRTHFGNEHAMLQFRNESGRLVPDFTAVDRYLDLYREHVGTPRRIVLQVWTVDMDAREKSTSIRLTQVHPDGRLSSIEQPIYGQAGTEELWRRVVQGLNERVEARGWSPESITLGIGADRRPHRDHVAFFNRIAPDWKWTMFTHARGDPRPRDGRLTINDMRVGFRVLPDVPRMNLPLGDRIAGGWQEGFLQLSSLRAYFTERSHPATFYTAMSKATRGQWGGLGRVGLDFWPRQGTTNARPLSLMTRFRTNNVLDINLMRDNPRIMTVQGDHGALGTVRLEMLRQGRQLNEARIVIEAALTDDDHRTALGAEWERAAREALERHLAAIEIGNRSWEWYVGFDWLNDAMTLYDLASIADEHR
ncbi:MAG: hypothetical protein JJU36_02505, partial [Phycisphaeraceae bacterium]|nr:hypothetical protein [Phycisphaeraceae bacterium]